MDRICLSRLTLLVMMAGFIIMLSFSGGAPAVAQESETGPSMVIDESVVTSKLSHDRHTYWPKTIDDVLYNPGMGFTTAGSFDGDAPGYPRSTIAYWGWYWETIEPEDGVYRWDIIDETMAEARSRGQRTAIRIMPTNGRNGVPQWYRDMGAAGFDYIAESNQIAGRDIKSWMPDHNDPLYLKYMGRIVKEFAERYDGHPDVDHVDIRSLGHWGEWHFSFVEPRPVVKPEIRRALVDIYTDNFHKTPLVICEDAAGEMAYAISKGAGWRADCLGDLGIWEGDFNHMRDRYQQRIDSTNAHDVWKRSPVVFETCAVMQTWVDKGFDVEFIFNEALRWHCSVLNNKSSHIPPGYWGVVEDFQRRMGYRLVLRHVTHYLQKKAGETLKLETSWENLGVAPPYRNYLIAFELRPMTEHVWYRRLVMDKKVRYISDVDTRKWLPGKHDLNVDWKLPSDLPPGKYQLALAVLDPYTKEPSVRLAIEGVDGQMWYNLSEIEILK